MFALFEEGHFRLESRHLPPSLDEELVALELLLLLVARSLMIIVVVGSLVRLERPRRRRQGEVSLAEFALGFFDLLLEAVDHGLGLVQFVVRLPRLEARVLHHLAHVFGAPVRKLLVHRSVHGGDIRRQCHELLAHDFIRLDGLAELRLHRTDLAGLVLVAARAREDRLLDLRICLEELAVRLHERRALVLSRCPEPLFLLEGRASDRRRRRRRRLGGHHGVFGLVGGRRRERRSRSEGSWFLLRHVFGREAL